MPAPFHGVRCSKELENLWGMEQMFGVSHVLEAEKVVVCTTYLARDAKLWWRMRVAAVMVDSSLAWEEFKGELWRQFLLGNSVKQVRTALQNLRHTGPVREYVRSYSALMLEIPSQPVDLR